MSESSEPNEHDDILPEEAFALLGNEIRIDIIWALSETPDESLSFSELRSRIDSTLQLFHMFADWSASDQQ